MPFFSPETTQQLKIYLRFYQNDKKRLGLSLFLAFAQTLTLLPVSLIIKQLFDQTIPEKKSTQLFVSLFILFLLFVLNAIILLWNRHVSLSLIKTIIYQIRTDLVERALFYGKSFYADEDLDQVHTNIVQNTERLDCMTSALLTQAIPGFLISVCLCVLLLFISPVLSLAIFFVMPCLYAANKYMGGFLKKRIRLFHKTFAEFSKGVSFILTFHDLIQTSSAEKMEQEKQQAHIHALRETSRKMAWLSTANSVGQSNLLIIAGILVLVVGGQGVIQETMSVGTLLSFYITLNLFSSQMKNVTGAMPVILEGFESLHALTPLLERTTFEQSTKLPYNGFHQQISFDHVTFTYNETFALKDIELTIPKRASIGIFGPSGCGKSTLINLLLGTIQPDQGSILIDEQNLQNVNAIDFRKTIGVLLQDPQMIPGSIRAYLTYGLQNITEQRLREICQLCFIHDHVSSLENGYDSEIGNRGTKFSGGQRQRLAIARALLRNPELLILDEPDNHLNDELLLSIIQNIKALGITLILISHNRNVGAFLDETYEFQNGKLINLHSSPNP